MGNTTPLSDSVNYNPLYVAVFKTNLLVLRLIDKRQYMFYNLLGGYISGDLPKMRLEVRVRQQGLIIVFGCFGIPPLVLTGFSD